MKKKKLKNLFIVLLVLLLVANNSIFTFAALYGGTEDIVAPTAEPTETTVKKISSGINATALIPNEVISPTTEVASIGTSPMDILQNGTVLNNNTTSLPTTNIYTYTEYTGKKPELTIGSTTGILVNCTTNQIYFNKKMTETELPAGLVNLMTAYIAIQHKNLSDILIVNKSAVKGIDKDAAIAALNDGDTITLKDAIASMFVKGCVDSANVIAENVSGSVDQFVELMNTTAKSMGCLSTIFKNPTGLDADGQVSTAYDMAIIMDAVTNSKELVELMALTEYTLPKAKMRGELRLYSKNTVLSKDSPNYNSGLACARLGYTKKAEYTMSAEFTYAGQKFVAVVLKASGTHFADVKKLYEYARSVYEASLVQ